MYFYELQVIPLNNKIIVLASFIVILISSVAIALQHFNTDAFLATASCVIPLILIYFSVGLVWYLMGGSGSFRITGAFIRRGFRVFISYKFQVIFTFFSMFIMLVLYWIVGKPFVELMMTSMSGGLLNYGGYNFLSFILVGMIAWPMLLSGYMIATSRIRQEQYTGMFEIMIPSKYGVRVLPFASLLMGISGSLIGSISTLIVFIYVLGVNLNVGNPLAVLGLISVIALSLLTMWGLGLILGGLTITYKQIGPAASLIQTIMMFFCGVYIPIQILPGWIQPVSYCLPLTYAFNAIRASLIGGEGILSYWENVVPLIIFFVVMVVGGYIIFNKLLNKGRKSGTIYGY